MDKLFVALLLSCCMVFIVNCNNNNAGSGVAIPVWKYGYKKFTRYQKGNLNLILTTPHGGYLQPSGLPERPLMGCYEDGECIYENGCGTESTNCKSIHTNDNNTQELTLVIAEKIHNLTGLRPHIIINQLLRKIFDANRDKPEATFGNVEVERAWDNFTNFIKMAKNEMINGGLLLDIHGVSVHPEKWIEVGYGVTGDVLDQQEEIDPNTTTIGHLASITQASYSFDNILRGEQSLGGRIEKLGHRVVPASKHPGPNGGKYFRGGYIVQTHGSLNGEGNVDAIQLETPKHLRSPRKLKQYGEELGQVIYEFHKQFYTSRNV